MKKKKKTIKTLGKQVADNLRNLEMSGEIRQSLGRQLLGKVMYDDII